MLSSACRTNPVKAMASEDLELLASRDSRYGVESILALFVRQAGLCTAGMFTRDPDGRQWFRHKQRARVMPTYGPRLASIAFAAHTTVGRPMSTL
jgi:hypothetical protein